MSKLITNTIRHTGGSADNITLDNSQNVTCENNLKVDGNVTVTGTIPADKLTGTASAINGSNITNLPAANLTGTLPAISGANLTGISSPLLFRNLCMNGGFQVWQRGTSSTSAGVQTADRFAVNVASTDQLAFTQARSTDTPTNASGYSFKYDTTTAETTIDANEYVNVNWKGLEGQDIQYWNWGTANALSLTLSFWVKSNVTGTYAVNAYNPDANRLINKTYTISAANTWEKKTISIPGDTSGTINNDNGKGFELYFHLVAGSDWTSADTSSWAAYSNAGWAYGHNVNLASSTSNEWIISDIQLETGSTATDFERRSYGEELVRCLRYYQTEEFTGNYQFIMMTIANGTLSMQGFNPIPYPMRVDPTITHNGVGNFRLNDWSGGDATCTALAFEWITKLGARWSFNKGSSGNNFTARYGGYINTEGGNDAAVYYDAEL